MSNINPAATRRLPTRDYGFHFTWFPYLPSFLCYIPAIAMALSEEASHDAGLTLLLVGSGFSILGNLLVRLRNDQMELHRELHDARQRFADVQNERPDK